MTQGAIIFAYNSATYNYYKMAEYTAKRINHFLNIPVSLVTDQNSLPKTSDYTWDTVVTNDPDRTNGRDGNVWINKGRYQAFEFSPYDETILLDADYIVNSNKLSNIFTVYDDFACHGTTNFLMYRDLPKDRLSNISHDMLWATIVAFKKTKRAKQVFDCIEMIQKNYDHYANIHGFLNIPYRNDFALTLALRIVNGHCILTKDIIPWNLTTIGLNTHIYSDSNDKFNTKYTVMFDNWQRGKIKKEYISIDKLDFHLLDKDNVMELING